jgi:hypothetical protein
MLAVSLVLSTSSPTTAQGPWGQPLYLNWTPDGGPLLTEFVVPHAGALGGLAGLATLAGGTPVILYDPGWIGQLGGLESPGFRFLRAHEYAHHRLGHPLAYLESLFGGMPYTDYAVELEADCWAVALLAEVADAPAVEAGFAIYSMLPAYDMGGRPGRHTRFQNMDSCLAN